MILPCRRSPSVKSVAGNEQGRMRTMRGVRFPWSCASSRPLLCPFCNWKPFFYFVKGGNMMETTDVPIWEKYTLTIEEASKYFRIGENKLRKLAEENTKSGWVIFNGNRIQIKRKQFEKIIDTLDVI